ncbi:MAG: septal ring lytic transglycosylase RlpA family protein [Candidatus Obscuribacterales bacterium]|nr:septal ring lytic transglycosylase RlpA family protein [Candidatus Obscuribacterales bacterium]
MRKELALFLLISIFSSTAVLAEDSSDLQPKESSKKTKSKKVKEKKTKSKSENDTLSDDSKDENESKTSDNKSQAGNKSSADDKSPVERTDKADAPKFSGNASWYGVPFHGRKTASGEIFDMNKLSAAHLKLPLPTRALVEDPRSGNTVIVKVNDRGPYAKNRVMDLSREAARQLGTMPRGVAFVEITVLQSRKKKQS